MTLQYYICYCIKQKITGLKKSYLFLYTGWLPPPGPSCRRIAGRPPSLPVLRLAAAPGTTVQDDCWQAALLTANLPVHRVKRAHLQRKMFAFMWASIIEEG